MNEIHERLRAALHAELPAAFQLRRELHAEPCVSGKEEPTLKRVLDALPEGDATERVATTGALRRNQVGAMIAAHVQPVLGAGETACTPGAVNASSDEFTVIVRGQGGHAAYPHLSRDSVLALAQIIVAAQQLVSRDADPMTPTVVTFGTVAAGSAPNAIPGQASARGTLRTMSEPWRHQLHHRFREIAEGIARVHGCEAEVRITHGEPVLVNDARLAEETGCILVDVAHHMPATLRSCGADDFAHFASVVPSLMLFVGTDTASGLHSPYFLPGDETVTAVAESLLAAYLAAARVIGAGG